MMGTMRARVALLLAVPTLAAALAGCGGDALALDPVAEAATRTTNTGSARVSFTATVSVGGLSLAMEGAGAFESRTGSGRLSYRIDLPAAAGGETTAEAIFDGSHGFVMYMRMPLLAPQLPPGKAWVKLDLARAGKSLGLDLDSLAQMRQSDPTQALQYLKGSSAVTELGYDRVRDVFTTHYGLVVDLRKLARQEPGSARAIDKLIDLMGASTFPAEVWVDEQGLLRRMSFSLTQRVPGTGQIFELQVREDLFDFGVPVSVKPPPAGRVVDLTALAAHAQAR